MTGAIFIVIMAFVAATLCGIVAWRYRFRSTRIDWTAFLAMSLGSVAIGAFYLSIFEVLWRGENGLSLAPYSRIIFGFVLLSTALMAVFVLRNNGGPHE